MSDRTDLEAFGDRWNKKTKAEVAFDPQDAELDQGVVSTGLDTVDNILGGGFPRGRISMLYGAESAGKTLLTQLAIADVQGKGGIAMYLDAERTFTPSWFEVTGVQLDKKKLIVLRPRTLEQGFDMITDALDNVKPDLLILDSLPALVPAAIMDAELEERDFIGLAARKGTMGISKATQFNHSTAFIIINQLRMKIGASKYESPQTYPGGKALRHHLSVVVMMRRGQWLYEETDDAERDKGTRIGYEMKLRVEKNKYGRPWEETNVKVFFDGVIDEVSALVGALIHRQVIRGNRGYFEVPGIEGKIHGWGKIEEMIRNDPELKARLIKM